MNYTKGERILYCGEKKWLVLIKDKPDRPFILVGSFTRKEDAILDQSAPNMYEALKTIKLHLDQPYCDAWYRIVGDPKKQHSLGDIVNEALAKAEGK